MKAFELFNGGWIHGEVALEINRSSGNRADCHATQGQRVAVLWATGFGQVDAPEWRRSRRKPTMPKRLARPQAASNRLAP